MRVSGEARVIANRYARALLQVVVEKKEDPERIERELAEVVALLESHADLGRTLGSPAVVSARRVAVVDDLVRRSKWTETTANLLRVMAAKERIPILEFVRESYRRQLDEHQNIEKAEVVTPQALSKAEEKALIGKLEQLTGKTVRAEFRTDSNLMGGLMVRIGNRIYDATVTAQLARFKERLLSAS
jgi:F-type H+-transporting ATPase subunit delta